MAHAPTLMLSKVETAVIGPLLADSGRASTDQCTGLLWPEQ